jgi:hypothetical protein
MYYVAMIVSENNVNSISVQSDDADWEWVWDTDTEDDGIDDIPEPEMSLPDVSLLDVGRPTAFVEQLNEIITRPEEKWRKRIHYGSESSGSNRSSFNMQKGTVIYFVRICSEISSHLQVFLI